MKKIFLIFTVLFTSISPMAGFGDYSDCSLEATREAFRIWSFNFDTKVPEKYKQQIQDIINSPVTHDSSGTCTPGGQFKCTKGQIYKDCCPCAQFGAESQAEKQFRQDYIKQKCGDKPKVVQAQVEELSPEDEVTAYDEYDPSQDSQGAPYATQQNNSWNTNYEDSDEIQETENTIKPDKSVVSQLGTKKTAPKQTDSKTRTALLSKAYSKYCDDEGYTPSHPTTDLGERYATKPTIDCSGEKGKVTLNCYKIKDIRQSLNQEDLKHFCSPDTITNFTIKTVTRPNTHIRKCKADEKKSINATDCKISADGKYSDIVCKAGYTKNTDGTKCEKSDTPDKKAKPELIKISGIVIDATSKDEQTIGGVRIKYDEGKKDKDGNKKYAQHQTGNNGRFAINIVPGSTITFTHKMYQDTTKSYSAEIKDEKIKMTHKSLAAQHGATVGEPCPDDVLKILNAESGTYKKDATTGLIYCNIKKCTSNLKITKTEKPEPINFTDLDIMLERCECPDNLPVKRSQNGVLECIPEELIHISGYVTNYKNEALPDVKIKIDKKTIKTDPSGHFTLSAQIGAKILLSHKGYKDYTHTIWADNTNPTIVMIEANAKNIQRGGNVIDEKGNPMPNVTIKYGNKKIQTDKDGRFDITAPKGTVVTLSAKGYEDIKITLDEDCPNCDIDMTPTKKSANNAKKKELCEKDGPNQGKWNETLKTCKCKGKAFFDEDEGCVESTQEYIDAEQALNNLYEQFTTQLEQIKNTDT